MSGGQMRGAPLGYDDTAVVSGWACAGQPVQHWFMPPAPSRSAMVQSVLHIKASELKYVMMAFTVPLVRHLGLGDRVAEGAEKPAPAPSGKGTTFA